MKLLLKLISVVAVCSMLLTGSQCLERDDDNENDIQIEEDMIQNEMKPSKLQENDIDNNDMSNDDDYDDNAEYEGDNVMELEEQDPVKRDNDATEDDKDANRDQFFPDGEDDPRSFKLRRHLKVRRRRRIIRMRRVSIPRPQPGHTRRRRRWGWKKDGKTRGLGF